jgi:N-acetylglucosamine-6-phosphate deacetylase
MGNKFWFASAVFEGAIHKDVQVTAESGVIAEIKVGVEQPKDSISFGGMGLPGFIDTHCHGGGGFFFSDREVRNIESIAKFHLNNGTTTLFASLVTEDKESLKSQVGQLGSMLPLSTIAGIHLEGPWLSSKFNGAHDVSSLRAPELSEVRDLFEASNGNLVSVSIAPELENAIEAISLLRSLGVNVALGHTDANAEETVLAIAAGARVITHFYSCMRPISHRTSTLALESLYNPSIFLEFILDGSHIQKKAIQLLLDVAQDRLIAVTDAISAAGMPDGEINLGKLSVTVQDGVAKLKGSDLLAGSTLTMNKAYKFLMDNFEVSPVRAVNYFSTNPARVYNLENVGSIEVGKLANFVVVNNQNEVVSVVYKGEVITPA